MSDKVGLKGKRVERNKYYLPAIPVRIYTLTGSTSNVIAVMNVNAS